MDKRVEKPAVINALPDGQNPSDTKFYQKYRYENGVEKEEIESPPLVELLPRELQADEFQKRLAGPVDEDEFH